MRIQTDHRRIDFKRDPEALREAAELFEQYLELKIRLAKVLARIDEHASFLGESCSSIAHFGARHRADPSESRMLADLGKAMVAAPELEAAIREARVPIRNASAVGRILENPAFQRPGDDWVREAELRSARDLRKKVTARIEETKQVAPGVVEISVFVTERSRDRFQRARVLASRARRKPLSESQAFTAITDHFLETFDPEGKGTGKRRVGPTSERPESRYIPPEVRRRIRARSGDRCEFPGCPNRVFLQKAHRKAKAEGGGQEVEDLFDFCTKHHTLFDAGAFWHVGWTRDGRPIFRTRQGEVLWPQGAFAPPPPDRPGGLPAGPSPPREALGRAPPAPGRAPPPADRVRERALTYAGRLYEALPFS